MTKHPEQHLIDILIIGDLAGVDEDTYTQYAEAAKALSPEGKKEYQRQKAETYLQIEEQEKRSEFRLYLAPDNGVRH